MSEKILIVDDDPNILQAYRRHLRKRFAVDTAHGGDEGLQAIAEQGPYAVVISDMAMPRMNGVQFLNAVRQALPDCVRIMLTGNADQKTAVEAVNVGSIFRFLNKPCPLDDLATAIELGLAQHRLVTAEKELLSKTLTGSVKVLTDVLSQVNPTAFGRASRVRRLVRQLYTLLKVDRVWECEIAAMLSQVGCVAVPEQTLAKAYRGEALVAEEQHSLTTHPQVGHDLIANIPRLDGVAEIVLYQEKRFDGGGFPEDNVRGDDIPIGARILKVALDYDALVISGLAEDQALAEFHQRQGWYDPLVARVLDRAIEIAPNWVVKTVDLWHLPLDSILADDVLTVNGTLLMSKGQDVSHSARARLLNHARLVGVREPIKVYLPEESAAAKPAEKVEPRQPQPA